MQDSKLKKNIVPFLVIILAASSIYGLPYFRYNYWETFKSVYSLTEQQMANLQSAYGLVGMFAYLAGGVLADKFSVKKLLVFSFAGTGITGLYLLTIPSYTVVLAIHGFWGISTLMTFWPAFIKAIRSMANEDEQSKAFGLMEGIRGFYNIILATIPVAIFATYEKAQMIETGMLRVVLYYSCALIFVGILTMILLKEPKEEVSNTKENDENKNTIKIFLSVIKKPSVWLICGIVFTSYSMNIAYYTFNPYSQNILMLSATVAATMTVMAQYVRPIAAASGGFLGDKIGVAKTVILGFVLMIIGTSGVILLNPSPSSALVFRLFLILIFLGMYALQGNHFALLSEGKISKAETGTAVGLISTIGYLPETIGSQIYIWFGKTFGEITVVDGVEEVVHTVSSYKAFYTYLTGLFVLGCVFALIFIAMYIKPNKK